MGGGVNGDFVSPPQSGGMEAYNYRELPIFASEKAVVFNIESSLKWFAYGKDLPSLLRELTTLESPLHRTSLVATLYFSWAVPEGEEQGCSCFVASSCSPSQEKCWLC